LSDVTGVAGVAVGASGVAGDAADIGDGLVSAGGLALNGSLLKLNANGFLQGAQGAQFLRSHQRQRAPGCFSAASAADAMDIRFGRVRHFVIDDVGDAFDVEAAGRDIRGDEYRIRPGPEPFDGGHALLLRAIGMKRGGADAKRGQPGCQLVRTNLGAAENEDRSRCFLAQPVRQPLRFLIRRHGLHGV
jgi:hypothetical protein